jgi:hypothetical protein
LKSIDVTKHFTEYDRSVLEHQDAYRDYFNRVRYILNQLLDSSESRSGKQPIEVNVLKEFSERFLNTIDALSMKYAYEDTHMMLLDLTESGFPNHMEFRRLNADLESKSSTLAKLTSKEKIRQRILDDLFETQQSPNHLLKEMSTHEYLERINYQTLFTQFTAGKLEILKKFNDENKTRRFLYTWGSYDSVTNRPYLYILVFDNPKLIKRKSTDVKRDLDFMETIRKSTHNTAPLKVIASDIDAAYEHVYPKVLKRIDLGPVYGTYSMDDHPYTDLIKSQFSSADFIFSYTTEVIFSVGEKRTGGFLSKGELRQIFKVDESNKDCMDRMVSELHRYMITTHPVAQQLTDKYPEDIKALAAPPYLCDPIPDWKDA